jgi:hypothetical protein
MAATGAVPAPGAFDQRYRSEKERGVERFLQGIGWGTAGAAPSKPKICEMTLVPEVPNAGKYHGQPVPVGGFDDLLIAYRASGLNNRRCSSLGNLLNSVGKREERI